MTGFQIIKNYFFNVGSRIWKPWNRALICIFDKKFPRISWHLKDVLEPIGSCTYFSPSSSTNTDAGPLLGVSSCMCALYT